MVLQDEAVIQHGVADEAGAAEALVGDAFACGQQFLVKFRLFLAVDVELPVVFQKVC